MLKVAPEGSPETAQETAQSLAVRFQNACQKIPFLSFELVVGSRARLAGWPG